MTNHTLRGQYREDDGTLELGTLDIEAKNGTFLDNSIGVVGTLTARRYAEGGGNTSIQITSSVGAWQFVAAEGECERIGMPVSS